MSDEIDVGGALKPNVNGKTDPNTDPNSKLGGSGSGGGGGGGGANATDEQKDAFSALLPVAKYNAGTLTNKLGQANKVYDIADQQSANLRGLAINQARRNASNEWYKQQQKEQSTYAALRNRMGNAAYGTGIKGLNRSMARYDDMSDVEAINQLRKDMDQADQNYYEAIMQTNNGRNEMAMDTEADLRKLGADYAAQAANISSDIALGREEGYNQIINTDDNTLNIPEEIPQEVFDKNVREAIQTVSSYDFLRPQNAKSSAGKIDNGSINLAGAANQAYWANNYNQRVRR